MFSINVSSKYIGTACLLHDALWTKPKRYDVSGKTISLLLSRREAGEKILNGPHTILGVFNSLET